MLRRLRGWWSLCFAAGWLARVSAMQLDLVVGRDVGITAHTEVAAADADRVMNGGVQQNSERAVDIFRRAAELGHASSQVALGMCLRNGIGVAKDATAAFAWFSQNVDAMWLLGSMYLDRGEFAVAREWLDKAQASASPDGMHWLGVMEEYGLGAPAANATAALEWYAKAADRGQTDAAYHLALMHAYGRGVRQDFSRGIALFQRAAIRGAHAGAMYHLGVMNLFGQGVPVNYDMARLWFQKAEARADPAFSDEARSARLELERSVRAARDANEAFLEDIEALNAV